MKTSTKIGSRIAELLKDQEKRVTEIAAVTGLTTETIRQITNGTIKNPGIETLNKIAGAFSLSLFELLNFSPLPKEATLEKIKIIDFLALKKSPTKNKLQTLIHSSSLTADRIRITTNEKEDSYFAVAVDEKLADQLTNAGMPIVKQGNLLIFTTTLTLQPHAILLAKIQKDSLILGMLLDSENESLWIKSIELPQKQVVTKIKKSNLLGVLHSIQFDT